MTSIGFNGHDLLGWAPLFGPEWQTKAQDAAKSATATVGGSARDVSVALKQWTDKLRTLQSTMAKGDARLVQDDLLVFIGADAVRERAAHELRPRLEVVATGQYDATTYTGRMALLGELGPFESAFHGAASVVSSIIKSRGFSDS